MADYRLGKVESRFADVIWNNEPISSGELVKLCEKEFNWKKSTTYTMLKRLCDKAVFVNKDGVVTSLIKRKELYAIQSEQFVDETFGGSLPSFVAAFTTNKKVSKQDIDEIRRLIDRYKEEDA